MQEFSHLIECDYPLISVILTTYNRHILLERSINSVLDQDYANFELIIVDDYSTDQTYIVVKRFIDKRIRYVKNEKNVGVIASKNRGLDISQGNYICFLDDDDVLKPFALKNVADSFSKLNSNRIKMLWFDIEDAKSGKQCGKRLGTPRNVSYKDLICDVFQGNYFIIIAYDCISKERFDERLLGDEGQLWKKLIKKFDAFYIPEVLYVQYRHHEYSRMSQLESLLKDLPRRILTKKIFLDNYGQDQKLYCPKRYGDTLEKLGILQILNEETKAGKESIINGLNYNFNTIIFLFLIVSLLIGPSRIKFLLTLAIMKFRSLVEFITSKI